MSEAFSSEDTRGGARTELRERSNRRDRIARLPVPGISI
jgi:hypothetical protein